MTGRHDLKQLGGRRGQHLLLLGKAIGQVEEVEVPQSTSKYFKVPQSTKKYLKVLDNWVRIVDNISS